MTIEELREKYNAYIKAKKGYLSHTKYYDDNRVPLTHHFTTYLDAKHNYTESCEVYVTQELLKEEVV